MVLSATRARMEALLKAVIQSMPPWSRRVAMAALLIMPRSPTITNCVMPKASRTRAISGLSVVGSAILPSCTVTATGQPRSSVMSP